MVGSIRIQIRVYLRSKHGEIIQFKTFDTDVNVNEVLKETLTTTKKDIIKIQMDRHYDKQDLYSI